MIRNTLLALLFVLVSAEAHAGSYLFGMTEREVDEVMSHYYPRGYDRDAVHRQMSAPFDCRSFGDLCREVGEEYALRIVETAWGRARRRNPIEMIDRAAQQQIEDLSLRWFERNYPDGVPERDPYWEAVPLAGSTCNDTVTETSGDFRIVLTSRRHSTGLFGWGRLRVEHFKRNFFGNFRPEPASRLEVVGFVSVEEDGNIVFVLISETKEDVKQVTVRASEGGLFVKIPYVEGSGGVTGHPVLNGFTCSGVFSF